MKDQSQGDILCLPGAAEIRRSQRWFAEFWAACWCCRSYGDLSPQRGRAVAGRPAGGGPSTNVAESWITIEDIQAVVGTKWPGADPEGQSVDRVGAH
ncbi:MAG: hypothetical protein QM757_08235 [Paludibaculum sp.]